MTIRVIVADDQSIVRAGLSTILNGQPDIEVIGQATDGHEAVALARELRPDVCLLDIRMPNLDGIEATRLLAGPDVNDPIAVVVITTFDSDEYVHGALKAGARGFLLKGAAPDQLIQAIHAAVQGDALIDPGVTARLLASFSANTVGAEPAQPLDALTEREEVVLRTVAQGKTNAEIGKELHISNEHRQVSPRQSHDQARRPKPSRTRHVGPRNETREVDRSGRRAQHRQMDGHRGTWSATVAAVTALISHTSFDCLDAYAMSVFWAQVLGFAEDPDDPNEPGHEECMIFSADGAQRLLFIEVPDAKQVKNRLHLDLVPAEGTRDEELDRLIALGARTVDDRRRPDGSGWVVLADPEGNEFCILRSDAERLDSANV